MWTRRVAAASLVVGVMLSGCTSERAASPSLDTSSGSSSTIVPPADLASTLVGAAGAGDALVVLQGDPVSGDRQATLRRADGSWQSLPEPPVLGPIASVGSTVAIGGVTCESGPCDDREGALTIAMLNDDRDEWVALDAPEVSLPSETEISTVAGPLTHAVFSIGDTSYVIDPDGTVAALPPAPLEAGQQSVSCFTDEYAVVVPLAATQFGAESQFTLTGDTQVLDLADPAAGWRAVGPVPAGAPTTYSDECAGGRFAFHWGDTQHVLSAATWEWFTERSTWTEINGSPMFDDGPGQIAVAPGGAVAFAVRSGGLNRRDGDGPWTSTGLTSGGVYATDDAVLTLDPESGTFEAVWEVGN